jgi:hypothetical protein
MRQTACLQGIGYLYHDRQRHLGGSPCLACGGASLFGCSAAAWPVVAAAQQAKRVRRIGILMNATAEEPEAQTYVAAFEQGMQEFGWSVGRNLRIDLRWGATTPTARASTWRSWHRFRRT